MSSEKIRKFCSGVFSKQISEYEYEERKLAHEFNFIRNCGLLKVLELVRRHWAGVYEYVSCGVGIEDAVWLLDRGIKVKAYQSIMLAGKTAGEAGETLRNKMNKYKEDQR